MPPLRSASLLFTLVAVAGCAGIRVETDYDPQVDFAALRTFAWLEPPLRDEPGADGAEASDPFARNTLLDKRVRAAVDEVLEGRGYRPAEGGPADFELRYRVVLRDKTVSQPLIVEGGYYRYPYSYSGYYGTYTYQEGTLILDVIDPRTEQIAWRGWGRAHTGDGHLDAEAVRRYVAKILERFPPVSPGMAGKAE